MRISRRSAIGLSAAGLAALALFGGLAARSGRLRADLPALKCLTPQQFSALSALAERWLPGEEGFPSPLEIGVPEKIDALLASADPGLAGEIGLALQVFDNALVSFLFDQRTDTFTGASPEAQRAMMLDWQSSSIPDRRTIYKALCGLIAATYWASEEVWPLIGYPGPLRPPTEAP